jgi:protein gp37
MRATTGISRAEHTWNPWEGCTKVSPGCENCYLFAPLRRSRRVPGA